MESLAAVGVPAATVEVENVLACPLVDFSEAAVGGSGDTIAGASLRIEGAVGGTAIFAMDPEHALEWLQGPGPAGPELEHFLERCQRLMGELAGAALRFDAPCIVGPARLEEGSLAEAVVGTHAPSDTLVLGATLHVGSEGGDWPAVAILLVDPKPLLAHLLASDESSAPPPVCVAGSDVEPASLRADGPVAD